MVVTVICVVRLSQAIYSLRQLDDADDRAESSATMIMKALDSNKDGKLSAREFIGAAAKHPLVVDIIDGKAA